MTAIPAHRPSLSPKSRLYAHPRVDMDKEHVTKVRHTVLSQEALGVQTQTALPPPPPGPRPMIESKER